MKFKYIGDADIASICGVHFTKGEIVDVPDEIAPVLENRAAYEKVVESKPAAKKKAKRKRKVISAVKAL